MMLREIICFLLISSHNNCKKNYKSCKFPKYVGGGGRMNKEDIYKLLFNVFFMPVEGQ